jgi:hypothetical protein
VEAPKELSVQDILESGELALNKEELRALISCVEDEIKKGGELIEIPINHHFSKGVYGREMVMPKGAFIVGKIHKHHNLNILSSGEVSVLSIDGVKRVKAPFTFVGSPGAKRVIYAHEEATWTVIHGTDLTEVDKIEEEFIAKDYSEVIESKEKILIGEG